MKLDEVKPANTKLFVSLTVVLSINKVPVYIICREVGNVNLNLPTAGNGCLIVNLIVFVGYEVEMVGIVASPVVVALGAFILVLV